MDYNPSYFSKKERFSWTSISKSSTRNSRPKLSIISHSYRTPMSSRGLNISLISRKMLSGDVMKRTVLIGKLKNHTCLFVGLTGRILPYTLIYMYITSNFKPLYYMHTFFHPWQFVNETVTFSPWEVTNSGCEEVGVIIGDQIWNPRKNVFWLGGKWI